MADLPVGADAFFLTASNIRSIFKAVGNGLTVKEIEEKYCKSLCRKYKKFVFLKIDVPVVPGNNNATVTSYELVRREMYEDVEEFFKDRPLDIGKMHDDLCEATIDDTHVTLHENIIKNWDELGIVQIDSLMETAYWADTQKENPDSCRNYHIVDQAYQQRLEVLKQLQDRMDDPNAVTDEEDEDFDFEQAEQERRDAKRKRSAKGIVEEPKLLIVEAAPGDVDEEHVPELEAVIVASPCKRQKMLEEEQQRLQEIESAE
jgi:hypothetical protein